jgi:hypothetical protein
VIRPIAIISVGRSLTAPASVSNSHNETLVARPAKNNRTVSSRFPEFASAGGRSSIACGIGWARQPVGSVCDSSTMSLRWYASSCHQFCGGSEGRTSSR